MKVRRDIASVPVRSAAETWDAIVTLISGPDTPDAATLKAAASVMQSLIADEHPAAVPITVSGCGDRLVIYCRYNEDALELGTSVDKLAWNPTGGLGWKITAPTEASDVTWMNGALKDRAPRITTHDVNKPPADGEETTKAAADNLSINWGVLSR